MSRAPLTVGRFKGRHNLLTPWWRAVLMADPCVYCGDKAAGLDHIRPRARGGSDQWDNRAPACRDCDTEKRDSSLIVFLLAEQLATRQIAKRRYEHVYARRSAIDALRHQIMTAFYRGNLRFTAIGRVQFASREGMRR